ncbi:hypothetical protein CGRA01v4_14128 [Colletotrichum graminicola]|nr:hypothetical protein CGRA01v4_14128 [Colletotrichum graminicola]
MICQATWIDFRSTPSGGPFIGLCRPQCRLSLSLQVTISPRAIVTRITSHALR